MLRTMTRVRGADDVKRFMLAGTRIIDFAVRGE
jgi:hypothetical protein